MRVEPLGLVLDLRPGESVMAAARRAGYYWPTVCGGHAQCTRCVVSVLEGAEHLSPMEPLERAALDAGRWLGRERPGERLACQVQVRGAVVVAKSGVRRARPGELGPEPSP